MSLETHSEPVVIHRDDGSTVTLKRVTAEDRHLTFRSEFRTARKILMLEDLALCGVPRSEWPKRFEEFNGRRISDADVIRWIDDPAGQYCAVRLSLALDKKDATNADVSALCLSGRELHEAAAGVMGLRLVEVSDPLPESAEVSKDASAQTATDSESTST